MTRLVIGGAQTLPGLAETCGHSGEWQAIADLNPDVSDPGNPTPGSALTMPTDWQIPPALAAQIPPPVSQPTTTRASTTTRP